MQGDFDTINIGGFPIDTRSAKVENNCERSSSSRIVVFQATFIATAGGEGAIVGILRGMKVNEMSPLKG